mmetsp:Transcript_6560/g.17597  ORF Transcript_6560/g.17597 Transcript_6560/m.17597 type:complete len:336 (+) Transcript_6560:88-1095(+)
MDGAEAKRTSSPPEASLEIRDVAAYRARVETAPSMWISEPLTPCTVMQHGVRNVLVARRTAFQSLVIAEIGPYGTALILDNRMQTTSGDEYLYHEPLVHVPCVLHGAPERVLILGGADGGAAREALKWDSVANVTVVDIDAEVVEACRAYLTDINQGCFDDERVQLHIGDALDFLASEGCCFDVIIGDLTDPVESGPSFRLFSKEFFELVKRRLEPTRGRFVVQAGSISLVEEPHLFARIHRTLRAVFPSVEPFATFVPTYGTPLGMCVASEARAPRPGTLSAESVDTLLAQRTPRGMRAFDGRFFHGLFGLPRNVRDAVAAETVVYSVDLFPSS